MLKIYKHIFFRAYFFCIKVFKEKEFPWFFGAAAMSMTFVGSIFMVFSLVEYLMQPTKFRGLHGYYGYLSFAALMMSAAIVKYNDYYKKIIADTEKNSVSRLRILDVISFAYILLLFAGLLTLGFLNREYM